MKFTLKMHEITHTTGDAMLHGRRRTIRRWKARKKLKSMTVNQRYRRGRHAARRARRRKFTFFCYYLRNLGIVLPSLLEAQLLRPRRSKRTTQPPGFLPHHSAKERLRPERLNAMCRRRVWALCSTLKLRAAFKTVYYTSHHWKSGALLFLVFTLLSLLRRACHPVYKCSTSSNSKVRAPRDAVSPLGAF